MSEDTKPKPQRAPIDFGAASVAIKTKLAQSVLDRVEARADTNPIIGYPIEKAPAASGLTRTHIFGAIRSKKLTARKAGRRTIIEHDELRRYVQSLPMAGR